MNVPREICDRLRSSDRKIRHAGYYDGFGRILYDSRRPGLKPMEGTEEMHILNGTVASTINLWNPARELIGKTTSFIMIREKLVALIVPHQKASYFLIVFEAGTPVARVEKARKKLLSSATR